MVLKEQFTALGAFIRLSLQGSRTALDDQLDGPCGTATLAERWRKRLRYRWHLRRLLRDCPRLLGDAGLALEEAKLEAAKPFWRG